MEHKLASIQVRNWGTIGGNLAHADAAGDPAPVLIALDATIKVSAKGNRTMPLEEFYTDLFETALQPDEMVLEVRFLLPAADSNDLPEVQPAGKRPGHRCRRRHHGGRSAGTCTDARIVLGNAGPRRYVRRRRRRFFSEEMRSDVSL